jgi:hypothetical protein
MKQAVVKGLFGHYDYWAEPRHIYPDTDYYLFTDLDIESDLFTVIKMDHTPKLERFVKIEPWKYIDAEYDRWIWMDANIYPTTQLPEIPEADIVALSHPTRDCAYQEASACVQLKRATVEELHPQMYSYKQQGYPEHNGMVQTGLLIRKPTEAVKDHAERWAMQIKTFSRRDQLSFNYCLWKMDDKPTVKTIEFKPTFFDHFKLVPHKR